MVVHTSAMARRTNYTVRTSTIACTVHCVHIFMHLFSWLSATANYFTHQEFPNLQYTFVCPSVRNRGSVETISQKRRVSMGVSYDTSYRQTSVYWMNCTKIRQHWTLICSELAQQLDSQVASEPHRTVGDSEFDFQPSQFLL